MSLKCFQRGCQTRLARHNPSIYCWQHGGWDGRTLIEAMRALVLSIGEVERGKEPIAK